MQPLDNNDNTGEKNELATLIGNFNPVWDAQKNIQKEEERISAEPALTAEEKSRGLTKEFQRAVQMAGMILEINLRVIVRMHGQMHRSRKY